MIIFYFGTRIRADILLIMIAIQKNLLHWSENDPYSDPLPKKCLLCEITYERSRFGFGRRNKDGLQHWCKSCIGTRQRKHKAHWNENNPYANTSLKRCSCCKISKLREEYILDRRKSDGLHCYCKLCEQTIRHKRYTRNRVKDMFNAAKQRSRLYGYEFNITLEDIFIPDYCPVFPWLKLEVGTNGQQQPNSPSLDRINNDLGYIKGNVCVISLRANTMKSDGTLDEHRRLLTYLEERLPTS